MSEEQVNNHLIRLAAGRQDRQGTDSDIRFGDKLTEALKPHHNNHRLVAMMMTVIKIIKIITSNFSPHNNNFTKDQKQIFILQPMQRKTRWFLPQGNDFI